MALVGLALAIVMLFGPVAVSDGELSPLVNAVRKAAISRGSIAFAGGGKRIEDEQVGMRLRDDFMFSEEFPQRAGAGLTAVAPGSATVAADQTPAEG